MLFNGPKKQIKLYYEMELAHTQKYRFSCEAPSKKHPENCQLISYKILFSICSINPESLQRNISKMYKKNLRLKVVLSILRLKQRQKGFLSSTLIYNQ